MYIFKWYAILIYTRFIGMSATIYVLLLPFIPNTNHLLQWLLKILKYIRKGSKEILISR
jgi:hypothetical protein